MKAGLKPYLDIAANGLWTSNQALAALLGLCPLLAVSHSVVNSLALGLASTVALVLSNGVIALARRHIDHEIRLPVFVLIIASIVTVIDLAMNAWFHELHKSLGIFIPLIVTNCAIMGRAEAFVSRHPVGQSLADGLFMGLGFTLALTLLGGFREIIGTGRLFNGAEQMLGAGAAHWAVQIIPDYPGFLLAILPPGAFIGLGLLIALKNLIDARHARKHITPAAPLPFQPSRKSAGTRP
jgi:electron transport complex protein RnfE